MSRGHTVLLVLVVFAVPFNFLSTPSLFVICDPLFFPLVHSGKKVDAIKGLRFARFPTILTLQLKRFIFDPVTMQRIKLHHCVTFPATLDMSRWAPSQNGDSVADNKPEDRDAKKESKPELMKSQFSSPFPLTYDLFAILVHDGIYCSAHFFFFWLLFFTLSSIGLVFFRLFRECNGWSLLGTDALL